MRAVFLVLATGLLLSGCRSRKVLRSSPPPPAVASTLVAGTLVTAPGSWTHSDGTTRYLLVVLPTGNRIDWRLRGSGPTASGAAAASAAQSSSWFIFVEAPDRIWFHDDAANLSCWTLEKDLRSQKLEAITNGVLQPDAGQIPAEVIPHLPADLQKLFPAGAAKPRPSI